MEIPKLVSSTINKWKIEVQKDVATGRDVHTNYLNPFKNAYLRGIAKTADARKASPVNIQEAFRAAAEEKNKP